MSNYQDMEIKAHLRYLHIAPRKVRAAVNIIKGKSAIEAEARLKFLKRRAAEPLLKLLKSAMANARNNFQIERERLMVKSIKVDQGPALKRFMPRARGVAAPIRKKQSHIALVLKIKD